MYDLLNIDPFLDYRSLFVQPWPKYGVKQRGGEWRTKHKSMGNRAIQAHLDGQYWIGTIARWYPEFAILDFDDCTPDKIDRVRIELGLTDSNSMRLPSESVNSYHLLFRPVYDDQPPTAKLLADVFKDYCITNGIEIYPQVNKFVRLPFGYGQTPCLDDGKEHLTRWQDLLYYFRKLDEFELKSIEFMQWEHRFLDDDDELCLNVDPHIMFSSGTGTQSAQELLKYGLQTSGTRNYSQGLIIAYFYRQGLPPDETVKRVCNWIRTNHHGLSKEYSANSGKVFDEIKRQVKSIYRTGHRQHYYPDLTDISHNGWITKTNLTRILNLSGGNMPRSKFTYNLISYCNPRSVRESISLHRNRLVSWSSHRTYQKHLDYLEQSAGMIKRGKLYVPGLISKSIKLLNWEHQPVSDAIFDDDRTPPKIETALSKNFEIEELKKLLQDHGLSRQNIYAILRRIYG